MKALILRLWLGIRSYILRCMCELRIHPKVNNIETSIKYLISNNCSLSRYGDGEILLMEGYDIAFQKSVPELRRRLIEVALATSNTRHMIGVPDVFHNLNEFNNKAKVFWENFLYKGNGLALINKYFKRNREYLDTNMTRFYEHFLDKSATAQYVFLWKTVWKDKKILIVEGMGSRLGVYNDLFDNTSDIKRILCPAENAFWYYEKILHLSKKHGKERLVLIALGPTATILAYDLSVAGLHALDVGHIDVEYEWYKMSASQKQAVHGRYVNEVSQRDIECCTDSSYLAQIIEVIA